MNARAQAISKLVARKNLALQEGSRSFESHQLNSSHGSRAATEEVTQRQNLRKLSVVILQGLPDATAWAELHIDTGTWLAAGSRHERCILHMWFCRFRVLCMTCTCTLSLAILCCSLKRRTLVWAMRAKPSGWSSSVCLSPTHGSMLR